MEMYKTVDAYINAQDEWTPALEKLRQLLLSTELVEAVKWGMPVYTLDNKNIVGIGVFKSYFGLWFHQGVFLEDSGKLLINAQEGKTVALRQMRFSSIDEISDNIVLAYVEEAIQNQKNGLEVKVQRKNKKLEIPQELHQAFEKHPKLFEAFQKFTSGKKREFAEYIMEAKRIDTKIKRLEEAKKQMNNHINYQLDELNETELFELTELDDEVSLYEAIVNNPSYSEDAKASARTELERLKNQQQKEL